MDAATRIREVLIVRRFGENATLPEHPTHIPLANDSELPDSQKVRYELG
jgi:hypothetical protein